MSSTPPQLRPGLPPLPERLTGLPLDSRGYPVPYFVAWPNGVPDFRVSDPAKLDAALKRSICWMCGQDLVGELTFVIGPMCAVNRISSEPPNHPECADFAGRACPFLARPKAERREANLPKGHTDPGGYSIRRNPGVVLLWTCLAYRVVWDHHRPPKPLFKIGAPARLDWLCEGRTATRDEVMASIESGYPLLEAPAKKDGPLALQELQRMYQQALTLVPAA